MSSEDIATFLQITGVDDENLASQFLEMSGGNLDSAISLYFEHGSSIASNNPSAGNNDAEIADRLQSEAYQGSDEVRAPIQSTVQRLVDDVPSFYTEPSRVGPRMFNGGGLNTIFNQAFGASGDDEEQDMFHRRQDVDDEDDDDEDNEYVDESQSNMTSDEELVQEIDSEGDVTYVRRRVMRRRPTRQLARRALQPQQTPHQRRLAQLFRPPWDIISQYDLNTAKAVGRESKKWIIVNVQDNSDFRCQQLNRDLWSNKDLKELIKENFIFLQYPKVSVVGSEYIGYYHFSEYPHIALLDPKTGERVKMWSEVPDLKIFIEQLVDFLSRFSLDPGHVNPIVQHKTRIDPDSMTEEQQMELAIQKSLGAYVDDKEGVIENGNDDENPIVLDSDDDEYSDFEELSGDDVNMEDSDIVEIVSPKDNETLLLPSPPKKENLDDLTDEEVFATILPTEHAEPDNDPALTTRIQIRSGDGSRVIRRFNKADPVRIIYEYIKNDFESVKGGKFFNLTSQRKNLIRTIEMSIEEAGLTNAAILLEIEDDA